MKLNRHFENLADNYLFVEVAGRVEAFRNANPQADIIRLGIGDVTRPLTAPVVAALEQGARDEGAAETFYGYGPEQGYPFLRQAIANYYAKRGVSLDLSEIFVSDGAKSDCGNLLDLFEQDNVVLMPDPVYPVYLDANVMAGRPIEFIAGNRENGFLPMPDGIKKADIIHLCSPNNPTGAAYTKDQLAEWVNFANSAGAVILFDAAYEAFAQSAGVPHSIYEVPGAQRCAIEICSFSKLAGFTGVRCGWAVVPNALGPLNGMWKRRQTTKTNGVSYIVQRGAEAVFTDAGMAACMENIAYYRNNAQVMGAALDAVGVWYTGGVDSPYIWMACPKGMGSWDFFDRLLAEAHVVGTPGAGFGANGEGYFRLSAFGDAQRTAEAAERLKGFLKGL